jgi:probable rRNA maturation factor
LEMTDAKSPVRFHFLLSFTLRNRRALQQSIRDLFKKEKKPLASIDYIFCDDAYLLKINQNFLRHDDYTDIITFDLSNQGASTTGEIYISIERVKENALHNDQSFTEELKRVMFHGALHLCGYKDKSKTDKAQMTKKEDYYLSKYKN